MKAYKRQKVAQNDIAEQDKALDKEKIELLWKHCTRFGANGEQDPALIQDYCMYLLSFLCLLRSNEALMINTTHLTYESIEAGRTLTIRLKFRKKDQENRLKSKFVLHENPTVPPYLCPVKAFINWVRCRGGQAGHLFLKLKHRGVTKDRMVHLFILGLVLKYSVDVCHV